jgi:DNA repair exonuclease SbcCD ATPase subunit
MDIGHDEVLTLDQGQIYALVGENKDTLGSNASGKTTLTKTFGCNLYGSRGMDLSLKEVQSWHTDSSPHIIGRYNVNGKALVVDRKIGHSLSFKYGDDLEVVGSQDDVQSQLNSILKLTPEQFLRLSIKEQGDFGGFLLKTGSEKLEFLKSFFDLSKIETGYEQVTALINDKEPKLSQMEGSCKAQRESLETLAANLAKHKLELDSVDTEFNSQELKSMLDNKHLMAQEVESIKNMDMPESDRTEIDAKLLELKTLTGVQVGLVDDFEFDRNNRVLALKEKRQALLLEVPEVEKALAAEKAKINEIKNIKNLIQKGELALGVIENQLDVENKSLLNTKEASCSQCQQALPHSHIESISTKILDNIKSINEKLELTVAKKKTYEMSLETFDEFSIQQSIFSLENKLEYVRSNNMIKEIDQYVSQVTSEINPHKSNLLSTAQSITSLKKDLESKLNSFRMEKEVKIAQKRTEMANLDRSHQELRSKIESVKSQFNNTKTYHDSMVESYNKRLSEYSEAGEELSILKEAKRCMSNQGFIGHIFDNILEELNYYINKYLREFPLVEDVQILLSSTKTAKSNKNQTKSINYTITKGDKEMSFGPMSGSQKTLLILAVDEALDTVLSSRLGVEVGWKVLDEQFMWVDTQNTDPLMEFLKTRSGDSNKTYIIVDHKVDYTTTFEQTIKIVKENGIARIEHE